MIRGTRHGVTLIEVVVGLAMLGTMLSALLVASGRMQRLRAAGADKATAVGLLDAAVGRFYREGFPRSDAEIPIESRHGWNLRVSRRPWQASPAQFDIGRLSIQDDARDGARADRVLASVEILLRR